jgi:hypothetical protein
MSMVGMFLAEFLARENGGFRVKQVLRSDSATSHLLLLVHAPVVRCPGREAQDLDS